VSRSAPSLLLIELGEECLDIIEPLDPSSGDIVVSLALPRLPLITPEPGLGRINHQSRPELDNAILSANHFDQVNALAHPHRKVDSPATVDAPEFSHGASVTLFL
jgi:hypothetical protein